MIANFFEVQYIDHQNKRTRKTRNNEGDISQNVH
ncbi:Uncharacterised protein [Escherichia coli]|nr:Uncharacterised protein [Escherichia coli]SWT84592.1 Uncharacterised protein [Klebsiella pneumoniae]GCN93222.1 hypothetical protein ExPCM12_01543 [Escherichia coli]GCO27033.1 hypothetical protein ExPCM14_01104 [Escherichia coli]GDU96651.1 hypothetical protein ExPUPEC79_03121 [Escherichia coli]